MWRNARCVLQNPPGRSIQFTPERPLKVAWISYFPIEYLPDLPPELASLPKLHPATWQRVLWEEFRHNPRLRLDIIVLRKHFPRSLCFERDNSRFHCIKTPGGFRAPTFYWFDTLLISKKLKQIQPDLVHAWGMEFGAGAVASRLNYPTVLTMQGIITWLARFFPLNAHMKI